MCVTIDVAQPTGDKQSMEGDGTIVRKSAVLDDSESTEEKIRSPASPFRMSPVLSLGLAHIHPIRLSRALL